MKDGWNNEMGGGWMDNIISDKESNNIGLYNVTVRYQYASARRHRELGCEE
jgi:hypothetical protein